LSKQASNKDLDEFLMSRKQAGFDIYGSRAFRPAGRVVRVPDLTRFLLDSGFDGAEKPPLTARRVISMFAWAIVVFQYVQMCLILFYALSHWFVNGYDPTAFLWGLLSFGYVYLGDFGLILILEFPLTLLAFVWLVNTNES
jgi:hypothetical protein